MRVDAFDFSLPKDQIALRPADPRDAARMFIVHADGSFEHAVVRDLPHYLNLGDALVLNDTKVFHARLHGRRVGRGGSEPKIEVMLHKRMSTDTFRAFARPARKLETGDRLQLGTSLGAVVVEKGDGGELAVRFDKSDTSLDFALAGEGEVPLPPYIASKREPDIRDETDYQTVFARAPGSVAAPTAGLHFTSELFDRLDAAGVLRETVTLHIGAGTFLPVSVANVSEHRMHAESVSLAGDVAGRLNRVRSAAKRIAAVGTTTLRTLETAASVDGRLQGLEGETDIFIAPGYRFRAVDILLTNFHLPRSTLFMLVSAFSGTEIMRAAYAEAIRERYRFYSYGDACLLFRPT